jgi:hypothetical protein
MSTTMLPAADGEAAAWEGIVSRQTKRPDRRPVGSRPRPPSGPTLRPSGHAAPRGVELCL